MLCKTQHTGHVLFVCVVLCCVVDMIVIQKWDGHVGLSTEIILAIHFGV